MAVIDWRALQWMDTKSFIDLAHQCDLRIDSAVLTRLGDHGLSSARDNQGKTIWSAAHLAVLWLFKQEIVRWDYPWRDDEHEPVDLSGLTAWLAPFRGWVNKSAFDAEWWQRFENEIEKNNPLGQARSLFRLLDASVVETTRGDTRLFLELDQFFESFWAIVSEQYQSSSRPGSRIDQAESAPSQPDAGHNGRSTGGELESPTNETNVSSTEDAKRTIGLDEEVLRSTDEYDEVESFTPADPFDALSRNGSHQTQAEMEREHARRAAQETSALIPLSGTENRSHNLADRVRDFETQERSFFDEEAWEALAAHYKTSLDIFQRDEEVGQLLKKLALVYLEKLDKAEEGTEFLLRALDRLPTDRTGLETAARLLTKQQRWEELAAIWQRAATMTQGEVSSEAWTSVARVLLEHLEKMPDAVQALRFALEANPYNRSARRALSELAALTPEERSGSNPLETPHGEWSRLASIAERWAARLDDAKDASDWYERAAELYLSGKSSVDRAFICLEAALERDPQRMSAFRRLEALARHQKRWTAFSDIVQRLIEREQQKGNILVLSLLTEMLTERKKTVKGAETIYGTLLEMIPRRENRDRFDEVASTRDTLSDSSTASSEDSTPPPSSFELTDVLPEDTSDLAGDVPDDEQTEVDPFFGVVSSARSRDPRGPTGNTESEDQ